MRTAESISTLSLPRAGEAGNLVTKTMVPRSGPISDRDLKKFQTFASSEPLLSGRFVNTAGTRTLVMVWFSKEISDVESLQKCVDAVDEVFHSIPWSTKTTFRYGGIPQLRTEIVRNLKHQQLTFIPATGLAYFLVLLLLFRRFSGVLAPLVPKNRALDEEVVAGFKGIGK